MIEVRDFAPDRFTMLTQQIKMESKTFKELLEASAASALHLNQKTMIFAGGQVKEFAV